MRSCRRDRGPIPARSRRSITCRTSRRYLGDISAISPQEHRPSLLDLLCDLESRPTLRQLLDVLPPLAPRWYSLANSPQADPGSAHLCLSLALSAVTDAAGVVRLRRGLASHHILRAACPLLSANSAENSPSLRVFRREAGGKEMRLPSSPATPMILIGPGAHQHSSRLMITTHSVSIVVPVAGTGIAPFRSFLHHRKYTWRRPSLGPCHVYFGCRAKGADYLYQEELEVRRIRRDEAETGTC